MKTEEHLYLSVHDLCIEVEILLALRVSALVEEVKLVKMILDLQEVELPAEPCLEYARGVLELLNDSVVLGNAGKVHQLEGYLMSDKKAQMDH